MPTGTGALYHQRMDVIPRTQVAFAVAARDASDSARMLVERAVSDFRPGDLARAARAVRVEMLMVFDRAVLAELARGATWAELAAATGLPEVDVERRYADVFRQWVRAGDTVGFLPTVTGAPHMGRVHDDNPEDAALALDQWRARHLDPWDEMSDLLYAQLV